MDLEKIFHDLESNQSNECEEAKRTLLEQFTQIKEQWLVQCMMEYYLRTGSVRIIEVLVRVQMPHDGYIFDRLAELLKNPTYRLQALNMFCFVVRKHPTWLFKVEKHRLIKDMLHWLKQLEIEKEIVPLMTALLAIIILLPIIPNLVPNFLNDLFNVFAHLASWNSQNNNRLPEDKLVHLQLGLQMLFHRLYGMFPCNFMAYITEFTKREKGGIFQHTIKPLLETVRLHPMLVTATADSECNSERWKEVQPHDVVVECMRLSLPFKYHKNLQRSETGRECKSLAKSVISVSSLYQPNLTYQQFKERQQHRLQANNTNANSTSTIWSPYHEIINSSHTPLTPTPTPYIMPLATSAALAANQANFSASGCSPPEAAVEATPETTPLKDNEMKRTSISHMSRTANPMAVKAIFATSQPTSPLRTKDSSAASVAQQQPAFYQRQYFNYPEVTATNTVQLTQLEQEFSNTRTVTRVTASDRRVQQMLQDRNQSQSPFQTIEAQTAKIGFHASPDNSHTPEIITNRTYQSPITPFTPISMLSGTPTIPTTPLPQPTNDRTNLTLTKLCDECNETDQTLCTEGGLQMPTSRSMQLLANGITRRIRMTSYCCNERSYETNDPIENSDNDNAIYTIKDVRRIKSCPSLYVNRPPPANCSTSVRIVQQKEFKENRILLSSIASAFNATTQYGGSMEKDLKMKKKKLLIDKCVQTEESVPAHNYENLLIQVLFENEEYRAAAEQTRRTPSEILEQFITRVLRNNSVERIDQEQFQLLCLQLECERYRREIHAERNRRLMGRSRDKRSLQMERDRLHEQLKDFAARNEELSMQLDKTKKISNERECDYQEELDALKIKYQQQLEQNRCLRQANDSLHSRLKEDTAQRRDINYELEALRGQVFSLTTELQHAQQLADLGSQYKQELARLEAELIVMGEVQIKCRDRLSQLDLNRSRGEELKILQETYNLELKDLKHTLYDKSSQLETARHKMYELHAQLLNNEKVITEQKRLLKAVKEEYEEMFKALNKKYETQKIILMQMEEKFMMSLHKPMQTSTNASSSPDMDRTDIASPVERVSPLSTSLASSESLSTSLRSSELRNLQQLVETDILEVRSEANLPAVISTGIAIEGQKLMPAFDLASSANTAANNILSAEINSSTASRSTTATATTAITTTTMPAAVTATTTATTTATINSDQPTTSSAITQKHIHFKL